MPTFEMADFLMHLNDHKQKQLLKLTDEIEDQSRRELISDYCTAIRTCFEHFQSQSIKELKDIIETLFNNNEANITLSTIHRAKGSESNRVLLLDYDDLPMRWSNQTPSQFTQEENLLYVALTRAKHELIIFGSPRSVSSPILDEDADNIIDAPIYQ